VSDDYLWDRSGPPDEEIAALERLLAPLGQRHPTSLPPALVAPAPGRRGPASYVILPLAAAAALVLAVAPRWLAHPAPANAPSWSVVEVEGPASIASRSIDEHSTLSVGQLLRTGVTGRVSLELGPVGHIDVGPSTDVSLVPASSGHYRFRLHSGAISAFIWADPGQFFVETRSSLAVDLGCAYTLDVDGRGEGTLRVTTGWVGFQMRDRQALIPAGAMCRTRAGRGPGTPYFEDAPAALRAAIETIDFGDRGAARDAAIDAAISSSRPRDALTLWHLLRRVDGPACDRVYDRLSALVPPPPDVTRDGVRAGNTQMLEQWWDRLGLGDTQWWHLMSRPWTEPTAR
jgi:hypothetical protein